MRYKVKKEMNIFHFRHLELKTNRNDQYD